jgi:hypothetical protein
MVNAQIGKLNQLESKYINPYSFKQILKAFSNNKLKKAEYDMALPSHFCDNSEILVLFKV